MNLNSKKFSYYYSRNARNLTFNDIEKIKKLIEIYRAESETHSQENKISNRILKTVKSLKSTENVLPILIDLYETSCKLSDGFWKKCFNILKINNNKDQIGQIYEFMCVSENKQKFMFAVDYFNYLLEHNWYDDVINLYKDIENLNLKKKNSFELNQSIIDLQSECYLLTAVAYNKRYNEYKNIDDAYRAIQLYENMDHRIKSQIIGNTCEIIWNRCELCADIGRYEDGLEILKMYKEKTPKLYSSHVLVIKYMMKYRHKFDLYIFDEEFLELKLELIQFPLIASDEDVEPYFFEVVEHYINKGDLENCLKLLLENECVLHEKQVYWIKLLEVVEKLDPDHKVVKENEDNFKSIFKYYSKSTYTQFYSKLKLQKLLNMENLSRKRKFSSN